MTLKRRASTRPFLAAVRGHQADIMATKPVPPRPVPRLYLATPDVDDPSPLMASLPGLLAAADVAAVLLRLKPTDQRTMISRVKALAPAIQTAAPRSCSMAMSNWWRAPAPMARI